MKTPNINNSTNVLVLPKLGVRIIRNPSKRELVSAFAAVNRDHSGGLRALITDQELHFWNGYYADHAEVQEFLGLSDPLSLHFWESYVALVVTGLFYDGDGDEADEQAWKEQQVAACAERVRNNPHIVRLYGPRVNIRAEDDDADYWV
jgi:hypothetical protein